MDFLLLSIDSSFPAPPFPLREPESRPTICRDCNTLLPLDATMALCITCAARQRAEKLARVATLSDGELIVQIVEESKNPPEVTKELIEDQLDLQLYLCDTRTEARRRWRRSLEIIAVSEPEVWIPTR